MKASVAICALVLSATVAVAAQKPGRWLGIWRSDDGFLFRGHLERTLFSFDIPGHRIIVFQQNPDEPAAATAIDNIFFRLFPVKKSEFPSVSPNILVSYRNYEQRYERKHFGRVVLSDLDVCKGASLRYESWELRTLDVKAPAQVYMATKVGDYVLVVGSAFNDSEDRAKMLSKFSQLCRTFKLRQTK